MAKFMLIKIGLMAEITDADTLREAALENSDAADSTAALCTAPRPARPGTKAA